MSFETEKKRELNELFATIGANSSSSAAYNTLRTLSEEEILACIIMKQLPDGTGIPSLI